MKTISHGSFLLMATLGAALCLAAQDKPNEKPLGKSRDRHATQRPDLRSAERVMLLKRMMDLPPERLDMLQATIKHIQQLSPEEKRQLRERLDNFGQLDSKEQHRLLEAFRNDERKKWEDFRHKHKNWSPDQRSRELRRIHSMAPHERKDYFNKLRRNNPPRGAPPPPPPRFPKHKKAPQENTGGGLAPDKR